MCIAFLSQPHSAVPGAGESLCVALGNIALAANNRVAHVPGAVDAVSTALAQHSSTLSMAEAATLALRNILRSGDSSCAIDNGSAVVPLARAGALHMTCPQVVTSVVAALYSLSSCPANCVSAARSGAIPIVVTALKSTLAAVLDGAGAASLAFLSTCLDLLCRLMLQASRVVGFGSYVHQLPTFAARDA